MRTLLLSLVIDSSFGNLFDYLKRNLKKRHAHAHVLEFSANGVKLFLCSRLVAYLEGHQINH